MSYLMLNRKTCGVFSLFVNSCSKNCIIGEGNRAEVCSRVLEEKKRKICQIPAIFLQQNRRLQYKDFGHHHLPTPKITAIWYFIIGGGMMFTVGFFDVPIM